jgi:hypothetical protein
MTRMETDLSTWRRKGGREEEMSIVVALRLCVMRLDELREQVAGTRFVVGHGGRLA